MCGAAVTFKRIALYVLLAYVVLNVIGYLVFGIGDTGISL